MTGQRAHIQRKHQHDDKESQQGVEDETSQGKTETIAGVEAAAGTIDSDWQRNSQWNFKQNSSYAHQHEN